MPDLAQLAALPAAGASRPPATEVLTSPKSISSKTGTFVAEVQMPLYRKRSNADGDVATARWRAVLARDRAADGSFVFAVKTTGVYCRPSCPARRPTASERRPSTRTAPLPGPPASAPAGAAGRTRYRRSSAPSPRRAGSSTRRKARRWRSASSPARSLFRRRTCSASFAAGSACRPSNMPSRIGPSACGAASATAGRCSMPVSKPATARHRACTTKRRATSG